MDAEAHHNVVDVGSPAKRPTSANECAPKLSTNTQQLVPLQVRSSKFPGGMGEEQRAAYVANKINEGKATNHLPESSAVLTPSIPPIPILIALQHSHNVSGEERKRVNRDLPEASAAPALPIPILSPPIPQLPPSPHQPEQTLKATARQHSCDVSNEERRRVDRGLPKAENVRKQTEPIKTPSRGTEGLYLAQAATYVKERLAKGSPACDKFPPRTHEEPPSKAAKIEAGQRVINVVNKGMANATENVPCIRIAPVLPILSTTHHTEANPGPHLLDEPKPFAGNHGDPGFPLTSSSVATRSIIRHEDARQQPEHAAVNMKMTNAPWRSPEVSTAVPIPTQERRGYTVVSKTYDGHLTPCSPQAEPLAPSAPDSPASPNDDLITRKGQSVGKQQTYDKKSYEAEAEALGHTSDDVNKGRETNATRLHGVEDELLIEAVESHGHSDERLPKSPELAQRVPDEPKTPEAASTLIQWPSQEAISNKGLNVLPHSRESATALTPHTSTPVNPSLAYSLHSSLELESWLRWKPPNTGESSKRLAYYAVNDRSQQSAIKRSPSPGAALTLSVLRARLVYTTQVILPTRLSYPPSRRVNTLPAWTGARRLLNVELVWRARCKPPNALEAIRRHSTTVISARIDKSVQRSPLRRVVPILPVRSLACSARVDNCRRRNGGLVWRVHKPPDATGHRPLIEAVNKTEKGGRQGHSPVAKPTSAPSARLPPTGPRSHPSSPISWRTSASLARSHSCTAFASLIGRCLHEALIIARANRKGCF